MATDEKQALSSFDEGDPEKIFEILQPLGEGYACGSMLVRRRPLVWNDNNIQHL